MTGRPVVSKRCGSMIRSVCGLCVQDGGGAQNFQFRIAGNQLLGWRITVM